MITEANFNVFEAITDLNASNLTQNLGLYFALGYWGLYLTFILIFELAEKARRKNFFIKLFLISKKDYELPIYDENA